MLDMAYEHVREWHIPGKLHMAYKHVTQLHMLNMAYEHVTQFHMCTLSTSYYVVIPHLTSYLAYEHVTQLHSYTVTQLHSYTCYTCYTVPHVYIEAEHIILCCNTTPDKLLGLWTCYTVTQLNIYTCYTCYTVTHVKHGLWTCYTVTHVYIEHIILCCNTTPDSYLETCLDKLWLISLEFKWVHIGSSFITAVGLLHWNWTLSTSYYIDVLLWSLSTYIIDVEYIIL